MIFYYKKGITVKRRSPFSYPRKEQTMQVLDRLKLELSNQQYFTDEQYTQFLSENDLTPETEYNKATMYITRE